jgi:predicted enzyme related to lactoylglutathione lyase
MGEGRMVGIEDTVGASFFFWKSIGDNVAQLFMDPGSVSWNELETRDAEKASAFYASLLGWKIEPLDYEGAPYWQINVDGKGQGGIMPMGEQIPSEVPSNWLVYFGVDDAREATEKAKSLGAKAMTEPTDVPGMLVFSVLTDPYGATFAIMTPVMPAPAM